MNMNMKREASYLPSLRFAHTPFLSPSVSYSCHRPPDGACSLALALVSGGHRHSAAGPVASQIQMRLSYFENRPSVDNLRIVSPTKSVIPLDRL